MHVNIECIKGQKEYNLKSLLPEVRVKQFRQKVY